MVEFVTVGGLRLDYLITHQGTAQVGRVGGNALFAAVGAAVWGADVGLLARIGDNYPAAATAAVRAQGIATAGLVTLAGAQDHRTFFAYTPDGRRDDTNPARHFARIGQPLPPVLHGYVHSTPAQDDPDNFEPLAPRPADWPEAYAGVTAVHLSPSPLASHLSLPDRLRAAGVKQITCDPGERYMIPGRIDEVRQLLPQLDAFLPSEMEVRSFFGEEMDLREAGTIFCHWGVPIVIIKNGADGVFVCSGGSCTHLPAYHHQADPRIVDVTGAGDSFCGGFMVGLSRSDDPLAAARHGAISASLVIEGYGALYGLSRRELASQRLLELGSKNPRS